MVRETEQLLGEGSRGEFRQAAIAMEAQQRALGIQFLPVMEEFVRQEDRARALRQRLGIAGKPEVEGIERLPEQPDARRPRRVEPAPDAGLGTRPPVRRSRTFPIARAARRRRRGPRPVPPQRRAPATAMKATLTSGASPSNSLRATANAWSSATIPVRSTIWPPITRNMSGTTTQSPL